MNHLDNCPACSRPWDDHTLRELREHHPSKDAHMPFREVGDGINLELPDVGRLSGGCAIRSMAFDTITGKYPGLAFSFVAPGGIKSAGEIVLVLDVEGMRSFEELVHQAVASAVAAAS